MVWILSSARTVTIAVHAWLCVCVCGRDYTRKHSARASAERVSVYVCGAFHEHGRMQRTIRTHAADTHTHNRTVQTTWKWCLHWLSVVALAALSKTFSVLFGISSMFVPYELCCACLCPSARVYGCDFVWTKVRVCVRQMLVCEARFFHIAGLLSYYPIHTHHTTTHSTAIRIHTCLCLVDCAYGRHTIHTYRIRGLRTYDMRAFISQMHMSIE